MRILALLLTCCLLVGCITEDDSTRPPRMKEGVRGPVAQVQAVITKEIARLPNLYGEHLLGQLQKLIAYKKLAVEPAIAALTGADERTQANLIYILGFLGGDQAHAAVVPFLRSKSAPMRYESAAALLSMDDWGGVPILLELMASPDRRQRFKAAKALKLKFSKDQGYEFDDPVTEREAALVRWKSWWSGRRSALIYGHNPAPTRPKKGSSGN